MVEHRLAKARVASSNLVSRSILPSGASRIGYGEVDRIPEQRACPAKARYPSGKGEVCKTFMRRFDSDPRLQILLHTPFNPSMRVCSFALPAKVSGLARYSVRSAGWVWAGRSVHGWPDRRGGWL